MLDWSYRILRGAIPHHDIISPRPLGSALLHAGDVLQPFPVLIASRLICVAEMVAYSSLLASIVFETPFRRWHAGHAAGVLLATLVNLHTFPLMAWYTVDGILICAVAARLLLPIAPLSWQRLALALACSGFAVIVKQSFAIAPVLALLTAGMSLARFEPNAWKPRLALAAAVAATPVLAYTAWVAAGGGLREMVSQFAHAGKVDWFVFLTRFDDWPTRLQLLLLLGATAVSFALTGVQRPRSRRPAPLQLAGRLLGTAAVVFPIAVDQLSGRGLWGLTLEWMLGVVLLMELGVHRRARAVGIWLLLIAYMTELSFGYATPNLVAGSVALYLLQRLWVGGVTEDLFAALASWHLGPLLRRAPALLLCLALVLTLPAYRIRTTHLYRELPASQLTASAAGASEAYRFIRVDPATAAYFSQIRQCIERYPARRVSVVPDTPTTSIAFKREPAMPITLVQPLEFAGATRQLRDAVRRLDERGDYLILVQTWAGISSGEGLPVTERLPVATLDTPPVTETGGSFYLDLIGSLSGERHACGSFIAIHKPPLSS